MNWDKITILKRFLLFLLLILSACLEPYNVNVSERENLLVVDAKLTNENKSHTVRLSRSIVNIDETPLLESNALVTILGNGGVKEELMEIEPGIYKTDSTKFLAKVGGKYKLSIITSDGKHYESDECEILTPSELDEIYLEKDISIDIENEELEGIRFYVNGKSLGNKYLRWTFEEAWKFRVPYPTMIGFDESKQIIYVPIENEFCWKQYNSNKIIIHSLNDQASGELAGKEVCFIPSNDTDRFQIRHSILIKQISISKEEYEFWSNLKLINEDGGDIFGVQPFSIQSNIKCLNDEDEIVLGYFQTGGVTTKRIYSTYKELGQLGLKLKYSHHCELDTVIVGNDNSYKSMYEIYEDLVLNGGFGLFDRAEGDMGPLNGLLLSRRSCVDCSQTGIVKKPKFWED